MLIWEPCIKMVMVSKKNEEKAVECWKIAALADSQIAIKNLIKYYTYKRDQAEINRWRRMLK